MTRFDLIGTPTSSFGLAFERTVRAESFRSRIAAIALALALFLAVLVVENVRLYVAQSHLAEENAQIAELSLHKKSVLALSEEITQLQAAERALHDLRRSAAQDAADLALIGQQLGPVRVETIQDAGRLWTLSGKARSVDELAAAQDNLSSLPFVHSAITTSGTDTGIVAYSLRIEKGRK